ncbi:MAG: DNA repair exonuclease SbcCD ATPase subunit [Natronomonas sp.]|jgi:DNA repair exonuclease SbcCD ATPase subunit
MLTYAGWGHQSLPCLDRSAGKDLVSRVPKATVTETTDELVDYCKTQAGLLSGRAETIGAEADELLDEIDEDIETLRERLEETPEDIGDIETEGDSLEEKQAIVEAKRARMSAFQDLAADYLELAADIREADPETALARIVDFESERDAPAYFDERTTILETVAEES